MAFTPEPSAVARRTFTVIVHDGVGCGAGLWAEVDELPGCLAFADNLSRIEQDVRDAIDDYLSKRGQNTADGPPLTLVFKREVVVPGEDIRCD
jgi:predicted RNase H-like HicB family nuclease